MLTSTTMSDSSTLSSETEVSCVNTYFIGYEWFPDGDRVNVDINNLSGGEKSCTQMNLIMSLWETMNPPFRYVTKI